ncbi:MAG: hypothetical protein AAB327_03900 [Actinomycetota bacterium]
MKNKFIVALAATLILANGATAAFADNGSDSDKSANSISHEDGRKFFNLTDAQKAAYKAELDANKAARKVIMATFHASMEKARDAFETAKESATTDEARKAAEVAFKTAVTTATEIKTAALKALTPPVKPTLTAEQIAAIEKYRQDMITYKAALTVYRDQREVIRETFKTARETAREAFKTARESATTDDARQVARDAYKTAINVARQAYEAARTALGDAPVKPVRPGFNS